MHTYTHTHPHTQESVGFCSEGMASLLACAARDRSCVCVCMCVCVCVCTCAQVYVKARGLFSACADVCMCVCVRVCVCVHTHVNSSAWDRSRPFFSLYAFSPLPLPTLHLCTFSSAYYSLAPLPFITSLLTSHSAHTPSEVCFPPALSLAFLYLQ
jgi:hypothetical protein